jgi:hypothetical protein
VSEPETLSKPVARGWWYVLRLLRFSWLAYIISTLGILSLYLFPLLPGAVMRQLLDLLADQGNAATARASIWALAAVLIGISLARTVLSLSWAGEKMLYLLCAA